ncbi:cupin domain-containing protein [candidate division KSB1 bacterium]|nr:cupin domain-containing protein [candidate division KSB1 bacterium]
MILDHYSLSPVKKFAGENVRNVTGRVVIGKETGAKNFCMRVFEVASDGYTPLHTHDWEHEIFFHAGEGEVWLDGDWHPVKPGSVAFIPGGQEHQIRNSATDTLVFVCLIPSGPPEL